MQLNVFFNWVNFPNFLLLIFTPPFQTVYVVRKVTLNSVGMYNCLWLLAACLKTHSNWVHHHSYYWLLKETMLWTKFGFCFWAILENVFMLDYSKTHYFSHIFHCCSTSLPGLSVMFIHVTVHFTVCVYMTTLCTVYTRMLAMFCGQTRCNEFWFIVWLSIVPPVILWWLSVR